MRQWQFRPWLVLVMLFFGSVMLASCGESAPPELTQAADAVEAMLKPVNLSRSMFTAASPDGTPSQYVSYLFSSMGAAEWPPSEAWADEMDREQMAAIRQPLLPADVAIVPRAPDPTVGKQLVISFDDDKGIVIARGYLDPADEPLLAREWKLANVQPATGVREIYQSNLELGMSPVSFPVP